MKRKDNDNSNKVSLFQLKQKALAGYQDDRSCNAWPIENLAPLAHMVAALRSE